MNNHLKVLLWINVLTHASWFILKRTVPVAYQKFKQRFGSEANHNLTETFYVSDKNSLSLEGKKG